MYLLKITSTHEWIKLAITYIVYVYRLYYPLGTPVLHSIRIAICIYPPLVELTWQNFISRDSSPNTLLILTFFRSIKVFIQALSKLPSPFSFQAFLISRFLKIEYHTPEHYIITQVVLNKSVNTIDGKILRSLSL